MITNAKIVSSESNPEEYHAQVAERGTPGFILSAHSLSEILRNPRRWVNGYVSPESKAKKWGELLDCSVLTPKQFGKRFAILPAGAPRKPTKAQINAKKPSPESVDAIKWWNEWEATHDGIEIISSEQSFAIQTAKETLLSDPLIRELIYTSGHQVWLSATWQDAPTGVTVGLRGLVDIAPTNDHPIFSNALFDLKTTSNASPGHFSRDAQSYRYDVQGALYLDLWNAATNEGRTDFGHVIQENYAPYEFRSPPPILSQRFLDYGRLSYQRALSIYCKAVSTGKWPSYDSGLQAWPLTDCADWFLSMDSVYDAIEEEEEDPEESPVEEVTP